MAQWIIWASPWCLSAAWRAAAEWTGELERGSSGSEEWEGLSRVYTAPAYLQPQEETGGEEVDRGMDRNAYRGEEKIYFTAAEGDYSGFVCIFSLDWSTVDMLLM